MFGTSAAFIATILVTYQSNLLFAQAQEARHYAMFFACGAWVLYMQSLAKFMYLLITFFKINSKYLNFLNITYFFNDFNIKKMSEG